jgi:hypothetical protein
LEVECINSRDYVVGNAELHLILEGTWIPVLDTELPKDGSIETFLKYGLVAMKNALDDTDQLQELAVKRFELLYAEMATKGGQKYKEIMQRDENCFDLRIDLDLASSVGSSGWRNIEAKG